MGRNFKNGKNQSRFKSVSLPVGRDSRSRWKARCYWVPTPLGGNVQNQYCTFAHFQDTLRLLLGVAAQNVSGRQFGYLRQFLLSETRRTPQAHRIAQALPGLRLQLQESASSSGPQPFRGCKPVAEIVAGSPHRKSKRRVRSGLGSVQQPGFLSRVRARALDIPVLPNLPPSSNINRNYGFGLKRIYRFVGEGFGRLCCKQRILKMGDGASPPGWGSGGGAR